MNYLQAIEDQCRALEASEKYQREYGLAIDAAYDKPSWIVLRLEKISDDLEALAKEILQR
jgi:hypothetical protein